MDSEDNEIIDISMDFENLDNSPPSKLKSSNFGGGIELLMNDKKKDSLKYFKYSVQFESFSDKKSFSFPLAIFTIFSTCFSFVSKLKKL